MNITLIGNKIVQDTKFLAFEKNNGVDVINITVDTDESWSYKLDVKYPEKCCSGKQLYNIINLSRTDNVCTAVLTKDMLPFTGKYIMQLRGISGDKVYHSDIFDCWIKYSIEPASTYDPVPSEFYQIEQNVTEMNNHPPKPGQNGYWLVWDITTSQYKESDIPLPDGMLPEVTADTSGKYLSNDGKKAYWAEVQTGTESKIDKIEVNGVEQPIVNKTVNIAVPTKTSDLSNDSGYITNEALDGYATKAELPTKVSQLENDSKFINESALDGYAKTVDIPTKTSQLNNDSGYITANDVPVKSVDGATGDVVTNAVKTTTQTLTDTQKQQARTNIGAGTSSFDGDYNSLTNKPTIPTKTSQLTNDSGFITDAALTGYAKTTDMPTKTSQLDNDSHYITASESPVQSVNTKTGAVVLTQDDVGDGTTYVRTHNDFTDALKTQINTNKDNIAMAEGDIDGLQTDVGTLKTNITSLQTALTSKQDVIVGAASTITEDNLATDRVLVSNSSGKVAVSNVTSTELGYLDGVTSNVQTQLDKKLETAPVTSVNSKTGVVQLNATDVSAIPSTLTGTVGQVLTKTADGQEWKDVDIPTALPNPNALTFTGAVTGSYDGSEPLTVNIPISGGGSGGSDALTAGYTLIMAETLTESSAINIADDGTYNEILIFIVCPSGEAISFSKFTGVLGWGNRLNNTNIALASGNKRGFWGHFFRVQMDNDKSVVAGEYADATLTNSTTNIFNIATNIKILHPVTSDAEMSGVLFSSTVALPAGSVIQILGR